MDVLVSHHIKDRCEWANKYGYMYEEVHEIIQLGRNDWLEVHVVDPSIDMHNIVHGSCMQEYKDSTSQVCRYHSAYSRETLVRYSSCAIIVVTF